MTEWGKRSSCCGVTLSHAEMRGGELRATRQTASDETYLSTFFPSYRDGLRDDLDHSVP